MLTAEHHDKEIMLALEKNMIGKFIYLPSNTADMHVIDNSNIIVVNSYCNADMFNIICNANSADLKFKNIRFY